MGWWELVDKYQKYKSVELGNQLGESLPLSSFFSLSNKMSSFRISICKLIIDHWIVDTFCAFNHGQH